MKMKAPVMLSLLTVLVLASPAKANREVQGVKLDAATDNYSKVIEIIVVGGLTSSFLKQIFDK